MPRSQKATEEIRPKTRRTHLPSCLYRKKGYILDTGSFKPGGVGTHAARFIVWQEEPHLLDHGVWEFVLHLCSEEATGLLREL